MAEGAKLIEGADLAVSFQALLKKIIKMIEKAHESNIRLQIFRLVLKDSTSLVEDIKYLNDKLDQPREEIEKLIQEKKAGNVLVGKSRQIRFWKFPVKCLSFNSRDENNMMVRDVKEILKEVREILKTMSEDKSEHEITCSPPQNKEIVIGMEEPWWRLKMEALKGGVSTFALTGLPGTGKTTLARRLCSDDQVKSKFGDHIFFVTFSKTPNFKVIVESLFQSYGKVPEFHSDKEAAKELGLLFSKISGSPILLVLDDVWASSEALIQNFKFQIPDYKILVTSRVTFPTIKSQIYMEPLRYADAVILFHRVTLPKDNGSDIPSEILVEEVVRSCKGLPLAIKLITRSPSQEPQQTWQSLPLAIKFIARSLCQGPQEMWQKMVKLWSQDHPILDSNSDLLNLLQGSLSVLEGVLIIKECFKDLGLFPEDQRNPPTVHFDMWAEQYDVKEAMNKIKKLVCLNLENLLVTRMLHFVYGLLLTMMMVWSPNQNLKSRSGASSPVRPRLSLETSVIRRDFSAPSLNVHPLPLPPGAPLLSPSPKLSPTVPKLESSSMKSQWQKGKLIGRGTFGRVYVATNRETGALRAMKEVEIFPDDPKSAECIKQLEQEIKVLSQLKHTNIVQYYGSEIVEERFYIFLEYVHPGSINKYVREHCGAMTESVVRNFTRHILSGLAYLHSKKTIHRDIKGANLLVDSTGVVKLADFGMAKHLTGHAADLSFKGSAYWMAPEFMLPVEQKDNSSDLALAVDIWSLGCTIIEMLTGKAPWSEFEPAAALFKVRTETPTIPETLSWEGKDFLRCCLQRNPAERSTASALLEHRFLKAQPPDVSHSMQSSNGINLMAKPLSPREQSEYLSDQLPTTSVQIAKGKANER